jgi:p-hydroxybenzoate 3-monooxygenase
VNDLTLRDTYSETALRRVWRCTHFCSSMTTMLHTSGEPYDEQLQQSWLASVTSSPLQGCAAPYPLALIHSRP